MNIYQSTKLQSVNKSRIEHHTHLLIRKSSRYIEDMCFGLLLYMCSVWVEDRKDRRRCPDDDDDDDYRGKWVSARLWLMQLCEIAQTCLWFTKMCWFSEEIGYGFE